VAAAVLGWLSFLHHHHSSISMADVSSECKSMFFFGKRDPGLFSFIKSIVLGEQMQQAKKKKETGVRVIKKGQRI